MCTFLMETKINKIICHKQKPRQTNQHYIYLLQSLYRPVFNKFAFLFFFSYSFLDLRTAFDLLDRNQDGRVTANELQFMLKNLGIDVRDELIDDLIQQASNGGKLQSHRKLAPLVFYVEFGFLFTFLLLFCYKIGRMDEKEFLQWVARIQAVKDEQTTPSTSKTTSTKEDADDEIAQDLIAAFR